MLDILSQIFKIWIRWKIKDPNDIKTSNTCNKLEVIALHKQRASKARAPSPPQGGQARLFFENPKNLLLKII